MSDPDRARTVRRFVSGLAATLGLAPGGVQAAAPQPVSPSAAPQAWLRYATEASTRIGARLSAADAVATRLRGDLAGMQGPDPAKGVTLRLAVWVDRQGRVSRIDAPLFAHPQPNDDLRALLIGLDLAVPPKDMLLPMRLSVTLKPADPPAPDAKGWAEGQRTAPRTVRVRYDVRR